MAFHEYVFFLMSYILCLLPVKGKLGASDSHIFFLKEEINQLVIHLDKSKVFGIIVRSEYQMGTENLPIIKESGSAKGRNETEHEAMGAPTVQ